MTLSEMTVWDRLHLLFPTCTADEIKTWYGEDEFGVESYDVTDNTIRRPWQDHERSWLNAEELRAAIDATKPRPWHLVAQEALKGTWLDDFDFDPINSGQVIEYRSPADGSSVFTIYETGRMFNWTGGSPKGFIGEHNEIASLLRAAGLTQFKTYKLVEDDGDTDSR
jgi:hypothetical protein